LARHQFAVIVLVAIALASSLWLVLDQLGAVSHTPQAFGVDAFENRFDDFPKTVQPGAVFGYVSDNPPNDPSALAEFYLTQYTLAPAIVKPSAKESLVILNDHTPQPDAKLLQANHLAIVRNVGNGILLCRGEKQ
jgi:hypothetical protein